MMKGKFHKNTEKSVKKLSITTVALLLVAVLAFGAAIGGTLAWLVGTPQRIQNTFTVGDIDLSLGGSGNGTNASENHLAAGKTITDYAQTVKVGEGSVACYLFIKITESVGFDNVLEYAVNEIWTPLEDADSTDSVSVEGVYYCSDARLQTLLAETVSHKIFKNDTITAKTVFDEEILEFYTLTVNAYAIQRATDEADVSDEYSAWKLASTLQPYDYD